MRLLPSTLPEKLFPAQAQIAVEKLLPGIVQTVKSRANLSNVIQVYGLYSRERLRMPMQSVVDLMRESIRITAARESSFEVSFSYADRVLAQKVTADLVSRIFVEFTREHLNMALMNLQFMTDSAERAGTAWEESMLKVRTARTAGKPPDRAELDVEIARQRYQSLREKVAEAEVLGELEKRRQGQNLELLDPASLPVDSHPPVAVPTILGCLAGALLG